MVLKNVNYVITINISFIMRMKGGAMMFVQRVFLEMILARNAFNVMMLKKKINFIIILRRVSIAMGQLK